MSCLDVFVDLFELTEEFPRSRNRLFDYHPQVHARAPSRHPFLSGKALALGVHTSIASVLQHRRQEIVSLDEHSPNVRVNNPNGAHSIVVIALGPDNHGQC